MTGPDQLLAKSVVGGREPVTLEAHLTDTARAAQAIFRRGSRLFDRWCEFFGVMAEDCTRFETTLEIACLLHDVGKANADFLLAVQSPGHAQTIRHEHLSALLMSVAEVRQWLEQGRDVDVDVVTAALLSHHFKASDRGEHAWCQPSHGGKSSVRLYLNHSEVRRTLDRVAKTAGLEPAPAMAYAAWGNVAPWLDAHKAGRSAAAAFQRDLRTNPRRRALHLAVKTSLICADAASSALVREGHPIEEWIASALHADAIAPNDIEQAILRPRREAVARRGREFRYHRFQDLAAEQPARALLLAACGAGKTIAAWRWLSSTAQRRSFGSVLFLYPTRGTATEGFRDYVGWAPEAESALVHGTSAYELDRILDNPPESLAGKRPGVSEADARLFALGLWSKRYFSATVDQFLAFLEHGYASTCLLPRLVDSAVVIDEVHSFDRRLFDNLVAFLRHFDVPVLCMTATLPPLRRQELVAAGLEVFPQPEHRAELSDLEASESHPRYNVRLVPTEDAAFEAACDAAKQGKRVLWVANTVARCQARSRAFETALGRAPITYHSRFRLEDRQRRHGETVSAFQSSGSAIAVTTQVCEMSLDLDAHVLVTELAPATSLVQRFGRANRHARPGDSTRAEVIVFDPGSHLPYEKDEIAAGRSFVAQVAGNGVSQRTLAEALDRHSTREALADGTARLLDSGYFALPGSLRGEDGDLRAAVLDSDVEQAIQRLRARRPIDALVVPAPRKVHLERTSVHDALPRFLGVVPGALYSPSLGLLTEITP